VQEEAEAEARKKREKAGRGRGQRSRVWADGPARPDRAPVSLSACVGVAFRNGNDFNSVGKVFFLDNSVGKAGAAG
jgi:hypothetical protein